MDPLRMTKTKKDTEILQIIMKIIRIAAGVICLQVRISQAVSFPHFQKKNRLSEMHIISRHSHRKRSNSSRKNNYNNNYNNNKSNNSNDIPLQQHQSTIPLKNLLQIKTQDDLDNDSDLHNNSHLHQPTATFAMQLEKQQQYAKQNKQFMFRNRSNNCGGNNVKIKV